MISAAYCVLIFLAVYLFKKKALGLITINTAIMLLALYFGKSAVAKIRLANNAAASSYQSVVAEVESVSSSKGLFKNKVDLKIKECSDLKMLEGFKITIFSKINPMLKPGDKIKTNIKTQKKEGPSKFEIRDNSIGSMFTNKIFYKKIGKETIARSLQNLKSRIDHAALKMESKTKTLFYALFMGQKDRSYEYASINNQFNTWGIGHLLARSGLHLILILIIIIGLLKLLFLPTVTRRIIATIIIIIFYMISAKAVPFTRALNMFLINEAAISKKHNTNMLSVFSLNTIFSILYSPIIVFFLDFQLSFGITFILIVCSSWKKEHPAQNIDPKF